MTKEYNTHLCTFMGREDNVKILLQYIERALALNAVDNYWMIDMTRNMSDHEYIYNEQQRLNEKFPGRVHIYNREVRGKELQDPEKIKEGIGGWKTFYQFLNRFNDNDIIAKCDDDTLYFDVETLQAAFKLRWDNKQPYLMHANCINNGITAYHQHKKGIWSTPETDVYPACGLTGPLFSFPEIACEHHKIFTADLQKSHDNIQKYQLNENILFQQRVSINFIFMLGSDRHALSKIDLQDEYETSCKLPQNEDRANCIIGDFTIAHHTYGVQEPIMEKLQTYEAYEALANALANKNDYTNKPVTDSVNQFTVFSTVKDEYLAKHPSNSNTKIIQHIESGLYIGVRGQKIEKVKFDKDRNKIPTGNFMLQSELYGAENVLDAALIDVDLDKSTLFEFTNSNKLIRTGGSRRELDEKYTPEKDFFPGHMIAKFFQGGYKTELVNFIKCDNGNYRIQSNTHKPFYLNAIINKNTGRMNLRWERDSACEFNVIDVSNETDTVDTISITRCTDDLMNDGTYYTLKSDNRKVFKAREYYWMVDHYLWELIPQGNNTYHIKLLADNMEDKYLTTEGSNFKVGAPVNWSRDGSILTQQGKDISLNLHFPGNY